MSEAQKQKLQKQFWDIANTLRGKMSADEFRDYILGFIFYKYPSESPPARRPTALIKGVPCLQGLKGLDAFL